MVDGNAPHTPVPLPRDARPRVLIEKITPCVDGGRYPVKRVTGDTVRVGADLVTDGHDSIAACVDYRSARSPAHGQALMQHVVNDRYAASFRVDALGAWFFGIRAWVDEFCSWRHAFERKLEAGQDVEIELAVAVQLLREVAGRAPADAAAELEQAASRLAEGAGTLEERVSRALDPDLARLAARWPDPASVSHTAQELEICVDRELAGFSAWYELFPRSWGRPGTHGTFKECAERLSYVAEMGFDVVYLPPIHPIGRTKRKGRNNAIVAQADDPGSPWAIGAHEGGHKAIHPQLGTLQDFRDFVARAREHGLEVALDVALQASPDHPYLRESPQWFKHRPDGSLQYAENPPKKYEDIYPFDFHSRDRERLWNELASIFYFWMEQGVRVFRVDNPHTKPLAFWRWCIGRIKQEHPDVIFLSEAFTRPKLMYALAKLGFSQSYTYFTWRNTKHEFVEYLTELTRTEKHEFFRPNFWPNTPDILPESLQHAGRPAFITRFVLAATLSSNYGIYGPAFELMENEPRPGAEEYIDNEKYEIRTWDLDRRDSLKPVIQRVNGIRKANRAFANNASLVFHPNDNEMLLTYSRMTDDGSNTVLVVVNLDPAHRQSGWVHLDLDSLGIKHDAPFQVHDVLTDARFIWEGPRNYVELDPHVMPAHIFTLRKRIRTEESFEYFM